MKNVFKTFASLIAALAFSLVSISFVAAANFPLSGRVTNQSGGPLPGSTVEVINPSNSMTVASATTDSTGYYTVSVLGGTYNVKVTPPTGSGFGAAIALNQNITSDTNLDFVLVPPGSVSLSGRVLDGLGNGLPNQYVNMYPAGGTPLPTVLTDASGNYSFQVGAGDYYLYVYGYNSDPANAPHYYYLQSTSPVSLAQTTVMDIQLPARKVSVHVQDPGANSVANVAMSTQGIYNPNLMLGSTPAYGYSYYFTGSPTYTDSSGNATMWLFPSVPGGNYTLTAAPPNGSGFATTNLQNVSVTADSSITMTLAAPVNLAGRVVDGLGNGLPNQYVNMYPAGGTPLPTVLTDASGNYSFQVAPGDYYLYVYGYNSDPANAPHYYYLQSTSPLSLSQDTVMDIQLPARKVSVHVQDPGANPVANVAMSTQGIYNPNLMLGSTPAYGYSYYFTGSPTYTDSYGNATMWLFPSVPGGNYTLTAAPPNGSSFATTNLQNVSVTADMSITMTLAAPVNLAGRVVDGLGNGLPNQYVNMYPAGGTPLPTVLTDASGNYSFQVAPGDYYLYVYGYNSDPVNAPHYYYLQSTSPLSLSQDTVMDIQLPARKVSVHVQGGGGSSVANVAMSTQGIYNPNLMLGSTSAYGYSYYFTGSPTYTDSSGNATMWLFPSVPGGTYTLTAAPPSGGAFATFNVQNVNVTSDKSIVIALQFVHDPPVTTATLSPSPDGSGTYCGTTTVSLSATAFSGFTVAATHYTVDGGPTQTYTSPFAVSGGGPHSISYWSVDNVGVFEITNTRSFTINSNPVVTITGPASGSIYAVNTPVNFTGTFTDAGGGTHTAQWTFDGSSQAGTINESTGAVSAAHTFTTPGVYMVGLAVTDSCGGTGTASTVGGLDALVVIYDPDGGFVTGGGWINSPAGAYVPSPTLTGKANFGFVSKYQHGANVPTGQTEFQFRVANFSFHSTAYDWLVVAGARAQYKGTGTVNGSGNYAFILTAIDGQINGGGGVDKFRIKIWDKANGAMIYDNQLGAADGADPSTVLGGGSIVIHN